MKRIHRTLPAAITAVLSLGMIVPTAQVAGAELSPIEELGKAIFYHDRGMLDKATEIMELIERLVGEHGKTVLMVTHDLDFVDTLATRTIVVGGGSLMADGSTHDVFSDDGLLDGLGLEPPPRYAVLPKTWQLDMLAM